MITVTFSAPAINYLLDQQLRALEKAFLVDGGLRERTTRARLDASRQQQRGER
jgi:four helix bundle suffix protein